MSFTLTSTPKKTAAKDSVIYLSPSKRQRTIPPPTPNNTHRSKHSTKEIYSWVFRSDAIAPCFIRDIFNLQPNEPGKFDFCWLGSVPCRNVKIIGMVVGVHVYEKRIVYTVDDGTSIVDCTHALHKTLPKPETENKYKSIETVKPPPLPPKPITNIGQFVQVIGRAQPQFESRHLVVDQIEIRSSSNDELIHTRVVRGLHRTSYSSTYDFVIPTSTQILYPQTPAKNVSNSFNLMLSSPPSSVSTSPIKEPAFSSPTKKVPAKQSPIKLRHPSRLHTADLTANTFRIYLKHYMDGAINNDPMADIPPTPTKRSQPDETPRPSLRYQSYSNATPRNIPRLDYGLEASSSVLPVSQPPPSQPKETRRGFTLSYLRRVPELSLLASRVVDAVSKRRVRDELKKMKDSGLLSRSAPSSKLSPAQKRAKMRELFRWAIIKHLREGCIIIWDGSVHRYSDIPVTSISRLWKSNTSTSTAGGNSTLFSNTLGPIPSFLTEDHDGDDDEGAISDPDPGEEAYVSLTPEFLADFVENAIKMLVERKEARRNPYAGATMAEILAVLKDDDRWQYIGVWLVDDALKTLEAESRVWQMGKGRWELTG